MTELRAPFPWYGGKSLAAPLVWRAFGNVPNYVEPFFGSGAVLLARPHAPKVETVNDKDGMISNFWRAVQKDPEEVARWCDYPVNEADLRARHKWLVEKGAPLIDRLFDDPDFSDAKIAGWWVWGISAWIGNGWCHVDMRLQRRRPILSNAHGHGVVNIRRTDAAATAGDGIYHTMPKISAPGMGVHAPSRKKPVTHRGKGVHKMPRNARGATGIFGVEGTRDGLLEIFAELSNRLRNVRVCCGDWKRIMGRSTLGVDTAHGMTPCGILLDPPYAHRVRKKRLYREDHAADVSDEVREWAIANGDNPQLRIALCGFDEEHEMPASWTKVAWASTSSAESRAKERVWFSPHCLAAVAQQELFGEAV